MLAFKRWTKAGFSALGVCTLSLYIRDEKGSYPHRKVSRIPNKIYLNVNKIL